MRTSTFRPGLLWLTLVGATACGTSAPAPEAGPTAASAAAESGAVVLAEGRTSWQDARLGALITEQLVLDPWIDATQVNVTVSDGVARLAYRDIAPDSAERARQIAALVPGVSRVEADLPTTAAGSGEGPTNTDEAAEEPAAVALLDSSATELDVVALGTPRAVEAAPAEPAVEASGGSAQTDDVARAASGDRPRTYRVRAGETLSLIARRTMGDGNAWPRIYELNRSLIGPNPEAISEGMELRIPQD